MPERNVSLPGSILLILAAVCLLFSQVAIAASPDRPVYEGTHVFSECLDRQTCTETSSWAVCGSDKYTLSEQEALLRGLDTVEFQLTQTASVFVSLKQIKTCFHGCGAWFDRAGGKNGWTYVGHALFDAPPGRYRLLIVADGQTGCGTGKKIGLCPSSCQVQIRVNHPGALRIQAVTHGGTTISGGNTEADGNNGLGNWVIDHTPFLNKSAHAPKAGSTGETRGNPPPTLRPAAAAIQEYQWWAHQRELASEQLTEEIIAGLKGAGFIIDKGLSYYPGTGTFWGLATGTVQLIRGDYIDAVNRFAGTIHYKEIGLLYSIILDVSSLPQSDNPAGEPRYGSTRSLITVLPPVK